MLTLQATGMQEFIKEVDTFSLTMRPKIMEVLRGLSFSILHYLVDNTPQWSGNAVYNWNWSVGSEDFSVDNSLSVINQDHGGTPEFKIHDTFAILANLHRQAGANATVIPFGVPIYISNAARDYDFNAYIARVEANPGEYLREINEGGHMVQKTVDFFSGGSLLLTDVQELYLQTLRINDFSNLGRIP